MKSMKLKREIIDEIHKHVLDEYPYECCGIVTGNELGQTVHLCENIQNKLHAEDPSTYVRDSRTAYFIERKVFDRIVSSAQEKGEHVIAFYHSHPEHEAYFSEEDLAVQTVFGEPEFPDSLQMVVSVMSNKIHDVKCFVWDSDNKSFIVLKDYC